MSDDPDRLLRSLLATPDRAPDEAFVLRLQRLATAEQRLRAARQAAWTRFAAEMLATAALIVAFLLLSRLGPLADSGSIIPLFSPAAAGLLLLALWVGVSVRPGGGVSGN
ncbi:MAG: hypothetical protein QOK17_2968 [Sphingomonadales bacterium]|jgi:hypothetical protein|nr:hypothetical protein [Sphingomonadales bacterium]